MELVVEVKAAFAGAGPDGPGKSKHDLHTVSAVTVQSTLYCVFAHAVVVHAVHEAAPSALNVVLALHGAQTLAPTPE